MATDQWLIQDPIQRANKRPKSIEDSTSVSEGDTVLEGDTTPSTEGDKVNETTNQQPANTTTVKVQFNNPADDMMEASDNNNQQHEEEITGSTINMAPSAGSYVIQQDSTTMSHWLVTKKTNECQPPFWAGYLEGEMHKIPWRTKGQNNKVNWEKQRNLDKSYQ